MFMLPRTELHSYVHDIKGTICLCSQGQNYIPMFMIPKVQYVYVPKGVNYIPMFMTTKVQYVYVPKGVNHIPMFMITEVQYVYVPKETTTFLCS